MSSVSYDATVQKASLSHVEHCVGNRTDLDRIGRAPGQQVRISRAANNVALYTVEGFSSDPPGTVGMTEAGMGRLEVTGEFEATVDARVVDETATDEEAEANGGFVERVVVGGSRELAVLAPHGGDIERDTDVQAHHVGMGLTALDPWVWICKGWRPGGRAHSHWHITSTDISPASFPLLKRMIGRPFTHAVSFHGFDIVSFPGDDIRIGGLAGNPLKAAMRDEIEQELRRNDKPWTVGVVRRGEQLSGMDPENIVNRLAPSGGLQIEQSRGARKDAAPHIAAAVITVYRSLFGLAS